LCLRFKSILSPNKARNDESLTTTTLDKVRLCISLGLR